ncbi:hypothetical protein CYJ76_04925 [Kytococcus schroeteri]|uniref:Acyl-CoA dehydrogenase n=1 Tax=Kytococcus schroeteri TaxID=138300 RepID=A0A2I1PBI6_9MICO|nr:hypothetical protein [Kytococcus schroeteri]PKZ41993.1 hypothetical protein CYJ76_04925 [Kytococcus schroeteri]
MTPVTHLIDLPTPLEVGDLPRWSTDPATLRDAVHRLTADVDWAGLTWPQLLDALARRGATDIGWSRLAEGHADAVRVLAQAGRTPEPGALYGVWASRSRGSGPVARPVPGGWEVSGELRFASGVGVLDRALVTAVDAEGTHRLLDLPVAGWEGDPASWPVTAMATSRSWTVPVRTTCAASAEVGAPGWYLARPAFLPGGVGVAAVWWGATVRVAREAGRFGAGAPPSPERARRHGLVRTELVAAGAVLQEAGRRLEELMPPGSMGEWDALGAGTREALAGLSQEVRAVVASAGTRVLGHVRVLGGAVGLAQDEDLARSVADLEVYLAQHPADRAAVGLGQPA